MNIKILGSALLITIPAILISYATDKQALTKEDILQRDKSLRKRVEKRSGGRDLQKKGEMLGDTIETLSKPLNIAGTTASVLAAASGDLHAKTAAATLRVTIMAVEELGKGIAKIITGVGRYQERSQKILSITEAMIEDITKSEEKIEDLTKKKDELLELDKPPERTCSIYFMLKDSKVDADHTPALKKVGNGRYSLFIRKKNGSVGEILDPQKLGIDMNNLEKLWDDKETSHKITLSCNHNIMKSIVSQGHTLKSSLNFEEVTESLGNIYKGRTIVQRKVREATDIFTDEKAKRLEKLKVIQAALKTERENYEEIIKLLQIKLMEETITEIDRKIYLDKTIIELNKDLKFYEQDAKGAVSTKNKSKAKKQILEMNEAAAKVTKELAYYQGLKIENSPENAPEKLNEDRKILITKVRELESLRKLGEARYLQEKGLDPDNIVKRSAIVKIYQEVDAIKEKIDKLNSRLEALEKGEH